MSVRDSTTQSKPVHVEIRPRDTYRHHVTVENAGDILSWSFFTRRKNIAFGLFYLLTGGRESIEASPIKRAGSVGLPGGGGGGGMPQLKNSASYEALSSSTGPIRTGSLARSVCSISGDSTNGIKDVIRASRCSVHIEPCAAPKPGHGSTSIAGGRSVILDDPSNELGRARTLDSKSSIEASSVIPLNSSLPDLRTLQMGATSISGANATEYVEVLPVERYESFAYTIYGHYQAPAAGVYVLYFDNSYSINTSKELFLTVSVGPTAPVPQEAFGGWMLKKKQRRLQGWARRWFQLDTRGTLAYFEDRFSPSRGTVDLHRCTITRIPQRLAMTIDSGSDTWHLRALNEDDFRRWSDQLNAIRAQSALESLTLDPNAGSNSNSAQAILSHSEIVTEKLQESERLLSELRAFAANEDDGNIKFLAPLEKTFQAFHDLYECLADYAVFLQRAGRRMSQASVGRALLSQHHVDASVDEFFDAQEMIITDISPEEDDEDDYGDDASFFASRSEAVHEELKVVKPLIITPQFQFRQRMPCVAPPCKVSIASILRKSLGKDMSSIAMPVALNEPLSALQRLCEEIEYSELLDQAAETPSSIDRLALIAAFAVSSYAGSVHRAERKPFTPLLGETFEYERLDKGFRFIAEKVCHRPLVIACHAHSSRWSFWQDQRGKNKSWGKSMEYTPMGNIHVFLPDTGDHFVWNKVVTCVRNILVGTKWVENVGDMLIKNLRTGDTAVITFKPNAGGGFFSNSAPSLVSNEVVGTIKSADGRASSRLSGRWDSLLCLEVPGEEPRLLWRASPVPNDHIEYYGFTQFAIGLNDLPGWLAPFLPTTDSRFRPDQRMLEDGLVDEAEIVKQKLEQSQREARQTMEEAGILWQPTWFHHQSSTLDDPNGEWVINDPEAYWNCRKRRDWPSVQTFW